MEITDINKREFIGKEFNCFEFKSDSILDYSPYFYDKYINTPGIVIDLHSYYPEYTNVRVGGGTTGKPQHDLYFPTHLIIKQLEEKERENALRPEMVDELINEYRTLLYRLCGTF